MPDSPDQIIRKLQQENKNLKKILKQKDKKLKQKDEELNLERRLWNSRESGWDPSTSTDLHRIEVFDGVISALFNFGDLAYPLFESELFRLYPESCGTGCSKVIPQPSCYCSKLWITSKFHSTNTVRSLYLKCRRDDYLAEIVLGDDPQ